MFFNLSRSLNELGRRIFNYSSLGAESFLAGTASCRIEVQGIDELFEEYKKQELIYNSNTKVEEQPWGDREFPALDHHRNLLTFYEAIK
jgi:hypothetical protein